MRRRRPALAPRSRAGFSLIEVMAVIVIVLILLAFLLPRLTGMREVIEEKATRTFLAQIRAAIGEVENETGDAPRSTWDEKWGPEPNDLNRGAECLYVTLWSEPFGGLGISEDRLENVDGDSLKKNPTTVASDSLFEIADEWGNPIAYFHHRDYGRTDVYQTYEADSGLEGTSTVKALQSSKTKGYHNPRGYQLISAGQDGIFGNEDDITNFDRD